MATSAIIKKMNDSSVDNTQTATIKTKQYDFGLPGTNKRFTRIYVTYKTDDEASDSLLIRAYLNGSASVSKTLTFSASASMTNAGEFLNLVGKTLELQYESAGQDFVLDDTIVEYTTIGHQP
jgi:hypothetical protein